MKKILLIISTLVLFSSCSDFLKENRETTISDEDAYNTKENLEAQLYGCYNAFYSSGMYMGRMNENLHTASGLLHWGRRRTTNDYLSGLFLAKYSDNNYNADLYSNHYNAIFRCNALIDALPGSPVDSVFKRQTEAEAKLLRGILYFTLVRVFGDVPLVTAKTTTATLSNPRVHYCEIYRQVLSDLDFAEANMLDKADQFARTGDLNRPNKWAATSFKAVVYAYIGSLLSSPNDNFWDWERKPAHKPNFAFCGVDEASDAWQKSLSLCEKVITQGPYSLAEKYSDLFDWDNGSIGGYPERIFTLQSVDAVSTSVMTAYYSLPTKLAGTKSQAVDNSNAGRVRPSRWLFYKWCETYGGELKNSTVNDPVPGTTSESIKIPVKYYEKCPDPRCEVTMYTYEFFQYVSKEKPSSSYKIYPYKSRLLSNYTKDSFQYLKKYYDSGFNNSAGNAGFYLLRLAELYLTAAEASAELSAGKGDQKWTEALGYINELHKRARVGTTSTQPTWQDGNHDFSTKAELIDAIMWEREFEMCGEGHEWFDTHRRGAAFLSNHISIPLNVFLQEREQGDYHERSSTTQTVSTQKGHWNYYYNGVLYPEDVDALRKSLLCAFPREEIIYNPKISETDVNDFNW